MVTLYDKYDISSQLLSSKEIPTNHFETSFNSRLVLLEALIVTRHLLLTVHFPTEKGKKNF